jgi:hypothetical protein
VDKQPERPEDWVAVQENPGAQQVGAQEGAAAAAFRRLPLPAAAAAAAAAA